MSQYKYSIIIPHKNIPELLQRCLDSVPTRDDVQIIIVDDNSDPEKVDFEHFPGIGCPNTEVYFDKTGKGAGYARNVGLEHAMGMWVLFADSDDYYNTHELQKLLDTDFSEYDVVAWSCMRITKEKNFEFNYFDTSNVNKESLFCMPEPWRKMVRRSLIIDNNIRFQETSISNDLMFSMQTAAASQNFSWYPKLIYNWEERSNSLSAKYSGGKLLEALNVSIGVNQYLKSQKKEKYYDRTSFYLHLLWMESPIQYWRYLLKILFYLGFEFAKNCNDDVAERICGESDTSKLLIVSLKVHVKRFLK